MTLPPKSTLSTRSLTRRQPTQKRAKERVERILIAASELIAETGSDAVRMTEVAARAGVPIGSLYQYFPDKAAILHMLAVRFMERMRETLAEAIRNVSSATEALSRIDAIVEAYYATLLNEPVVRDVWSGTQSDKELQALDIEDSRANGNLVFEALRTYVKDDDLQRFEAACFLLMQMAGTAVRLAIAVERAEGDRLIVEFCRIVRGEITAFVSV